MDKPTSENMLRIGITHGDVNGIAYEVIMKSLMDARILDLFTPVVYGSSKVASYYKKTLDINDFNFNIIKSADQALEGKANLVNLYQQEIKITLGQSSETAGEVALMALEAAVADLKNGTIDALVTGPINKQNIQSKQFPFPGHTEYLTRKFGMEESLMLMIGLDMRIGVITGHVPLQKVSGLITRELIIKRLNLLKKSLLVDFGIRKPRIALLGINPHSGDKGVIGNEEQEVLIPAIQQALDMGILAFGPYPADGFFGAGMYKNFDAVLAMYHDQGLIPFKLLSALKGVNYTAGLPIVRTSPAHGTAYELAGKNEANPDSFREAIYLAIDILKNRRMHKEITANPLSATVLDADSDSDKNILKNLPDMAD